jgi:hypothetical protein
VTDDEREHMGKLQAALLEASEYAERLLAENVRLNNEAGEMRAALDAARSDVVRLTEQLEYQALLANARKETIDETKRAWDREHSRAEVLAAEVKAWRHDHERRSHGHNDGAYAVHVAAKATDRTHALDPAKFEEQP